MGIAEWLSIVAFLACALAVLPGSLVVSALTNTIAAGTRGARFIYDRSRILLAASAVLLAAALYLSTSGGGFSPVVLAAAAAYGAVLVFGFVLHMKLMFRPVRNPTFISVEEALARFGPDEEVIGVVDRNKRPFAFVTRLARRPHIVHQPDGEAPFVMTHCVLSHSSMAYRAEGRWSRPAWNVAAALANNLVFYDRQNGCAVSQIQNRSRDGNLDLDALPTVAASLKTWGALYPDSRVWVRPFTWRDRFFMEVMSRGDVINPSNPKLIYPLQRPADERLGLKSLVVGIQVGDAAKAYPLDLIEQHRVINDTVGGKPLVVVSGYGGDYIQVFDRAPGGTVLSFRTAGSGEGFVEEHTGSEFTPAGLSTAGPHAGLQLEPIPHFSKIFWFPWADYFPQTEVFSSRRVGVSA